MILSTTASLHSMLHPFMPSASVFPYPVFINNLHSRLWNGSLLVHCQLSSVTVLCQLFPGCCFTARNNYAPLYIAFSAYTISGTTNSITYWLFYLGTCHNARLAQANPNYACVSCSLISSRVYLFKTIG